MKNKKHIQNHPNQDESGRAPYSSSTQRNSSTNKTITDSVNMPRGAESDYKGELLQKETNQHSSRRPKQ
jgi:hypothetical protein